MSMGAAHPGYKLHHETSLLTPGTYMQVMQELNRQLHKFLDMTNAQIVNAEVSFLRLQLHNLPALPPG